MKKLIAISSALALGLAVAACDGPREEAAEDTGEANAEAVNEQAEAMEDAGTMTDEQADAMTDTAEDKADAMEDAGEAADEGDGAAPAPAAT